MCCKEISQMMNKMSPEGVGCITLHPGFQSVCLNPWVLQTAMYKVMVQMLLKEHLVSKSIIYLSPLRAHSMVFIHYLQEI